MLKIQVTNLKKSKYYVVYQYLMSYNLYILINIYAQWRYCVPYHMDTGSGVHPLLCRKATMEPPAEGEAA
jgi:hypothetical protein